MDLSQVKRNVAKGAVAAGARVILAIPLYLILTPYVLNKLGTEVFGLWSFNTIIISFITLTNFGFKNSLVHHAAKEYEDEDKVNTYFNITFILFFLLVVVAVACVYQLGGFIADKLLNVSDFYFDQALFVLNITAISFGLRFLAAPYQAIIEAYQKVYYVQYVTLAWLIFNFVATLVALHYRQDVYALGIVSLLGNILFFLSMYFYVRQQHRFIRLSFSAVKKKAILPLLKYGAGIHGATLITAIREPFYKIIIAQQFGLSAVAVFEVVNRLCIQVISVVISPVLSTFSVSALLANRKNELQQIIRPIFGFTLSAFIPLSLFFITFSNELISFWLGSGKLDVAKMFPLMFCAFAIYYVTEPLYKTIQGVGGSNYSLVIQVFSFLISMSVLFGFNYDYQILVPLSLFSGFLFFSLSNFIFFRVKVNGVKIINFLQLIGIIIPIILFVGCAVYFDTKWIPVFFIVHLLVHSYLILKLDVFNYVKVFHKIIKR